MDTVEYEVKQALADLSQIPFASIEDSAIISVDLDLDSLELVNLAQDLEEKFGIELSNSDVRADMTVADLVRVVIGKVPANETQTR